MARPLKESASESESNKYYTATGTGVAGYKNSQKAKNQATLQAQQLYLSKHIHDNGPKTKPQVGPLDFDSLNDEELIKYNEKYNVGLPHPVSINNDILNSDIGKKTYSKRAKQRSRGGITKPEMASHLKNHFLNLPCRENEIITSFLYKVKHQDNDFKLTFK